MLVYDEKIPRHFLRTAVVAGVLPSRDSEIRRAVARIANINTTLKRPVNKIFTVENTYHDIDEKDRQQKLRREAAVIGELKRKY